MAVKLSQNGWPALQPNSPKLYTWVIPSKTGRFTMRFRNGSAGFILAFWFLWYSEKIEKVKGIILDDWGHAYRPVRDGEDMSNHSSGTAGDANALKHPLGKVGTLTAKQVKKMHKKLNGVLLRGAIRWGGDYRGRKDEMHYEIVQSLGYCEKVAKRLMKTPRGRRLLKANPTQKAVILS